MIYMMYILCIELISYVTIYLIHAYFLFIEQNEVSMKQKCPI